MMIDQCRDNLCFFNDDYISIRNGSVEIVETAAQGAGIITFIVDGDAVHIKAHNKPPLLWSLRNPKCADGAFLTFDGEDVDLHIVELKSTLGQGEWVKVIKQFEGMFFSSLAVAGVMKIGSIRSVTCYIGYKNDRMNPTTTSSPALIKTHVGKPNPYSGAIEWETCSLGLPHATSASIKKIVRDQNTGNAQYTLV